MKPFAFWMAMMISLACLVADACGEAMSTNRRAVRPNVLLIVSEDNGPELGCYGDEFATTPQLDQLATDGMRFEVAYVTQSVCSPSRSTIFTGLYPHQNGQLGLATHQYAMFKPWPTSYSLLKNAGYRTGLIGKTHVNPKSMVEDWVDFRAIPSANFKKKSLAEYAAKSAEFFAASDDPFFLTVNFPDAHWPVQDQVEGRPKVVLSEKQVAPMKYIGFDNPRLRRHVTGYYNCMSRLDECVGELMAALERSGKTQNTLVIYIGDHGAQFARGKVFVTEGGLRIPFIVKWPGVIEPGQVSNQMVSTVDLLPTIAAACDVNAPDGLPGKNLVPTFQGSTAPIREYLFGQRNCDSVDLYFPQRAVRDKRYKLIKTLLSDRPDPGAQKCLRNGASNFRGSPTTDELNTARESTRVAYETWLHPPKYQLYDLKTDPFEFVNLAADQKYAAVLNRMKRRLDRWQDETNDPLRKPELLALLTAETDRCAQQKIRSTRGGWQYVNYLSPNRIANSAENSNSPADIPYAVTRIWDEAPHSAFTDLIRWHGRLYCAFRTGTGHVPGAKGEDGKIQVIHSSDGKIWKPLPAVVETGIDLRDPKLSVTPEGALMLLMGGSNYDGVKLVDRAPRVSFLTKDADAFTPVQPAEFDEQLKDDGNWLWRLTWHQNVGWGVVYQSDKSPWGLHLVKTVDGIQYDTVTTFAIRGKPNESTIRFDENGEMYVVVRNEDARRIGHFGKSRSPFSDWNWVPIDARLGGPEFIQLANGKWLLGTRAYGKSPTTVLGELQQSGHFDRWITFPSGGDTSYPGMLVHQDHLWISYYSSHEGKSAIYLARIKLSDLQSR